MIWEVAKEEAEQEVEETRALPSPALEQLALILNGCEAHGDWPEVFQEVHTTFLQKKLVSDPSSVRPIGVACIPYRLLEFCALSGATKLGRESVSPFPKCLPLL